MIEIPKYRAITVYTHLAKILIQVKKTQIAWTIPTDFILDRYILDLKLEEEKNIFIPFLYQFDPWCHAK